MGVYINVAIYEIGGFLPPVSNFKIRVGGEQNVGYPRSHKSD
jgi:hypothetical protein